MKKIFVLSVVLLAGCSTQVIAPADNHIESGVVCITPDDSDRKVAYNCTIDALQKKGFKVKEVPYGHTEGCDAIIHCQTISRWDLANFTQSISYTWNENGKVIGRCNYFAENQLNFSKFINTEEKVNDLLNKMLPKSKKLKSRYEQQSANW